MDGVHIMTSCDDSDTDYVDQMHAPSAGSIARRDAVCSIAGGTCFFMVAEWGDVREQRHLCVRKVVSFDFNDILKEI